MEGLLGAIYASEEIQEPEAQISAQNRIYRGLIRPQSKVLPMHQSLKDIILREWKEPERKVLRFKTWNCRCPLEEEEEEEKFFESPKLDASLAQVSKQSNLSFDNRQYTGPDGPSVRDPFA